MVKKPVSTDELISIIIKGIDDVKGDDIQLLDLREIENTVCDYFIICSGSSNTQVNAITGSIQKLVSKELKDKPWHVEGQNNSEWILSTYQITTLPKQKCEYTPTLVAMMASLVSSLQTKWNGL